ncbi:pyrimidine utilization protein D [Falsirhodobacter sp. alg1]|uniref:pyrimidine utilization protein D n=1 Tax=Falsirhodobacter sp. alg1 TaxID=1472418 RepID=UPI00128F3848|nr:pyrimidine utilization protein D [Falsirhodobacter sp. alg1]
MHYTVYGGPEGADTVILSSGLGGSGTYWAPQMDALTGRYRVITYDHRGCGKTGGEVPDSTTISDMADDLAMVLDASETPRAHVVGHALGALIGMELALSAPDRVSSILAINAWAKTSDHSRRCFEARLRLLDISVEAFVRAQPLFLYPGNWMEEHADRMAAEDAHHIAHFQGAENVRRRIAALSAFDITDRLHALTCPVLALATKDDLLVPYSRSETLIQSLPKGSLHMMDHGAHAVNITQPDAFNIEMMRFLEGL